MTYRDVHFRLESGYEWGSGMEKTKTEAFFDEITELFTMDASGELQEDLVEEVENILSKGTTFTHYRTDIYGELKDMSDDEYVAWLESNKQDIEADLFQAFTTKRRNLYITDTSGVIRKIKEKYHIPRLKAHIGRSSNDVEWRYVTKLFKEMVADGLFVTANCKSGIGYRTPKKGDFEQRQYG